MAGWVCLVGGLGVFVAGILVLCFGCYWGGIEYGWKAFMPCFFFALIILGVSCWLVGIGMHAVDPVFSGRVP